MDLQQQNPDITFIGVPEPDESIDSAASFVEGTDSGTFAHLHDPNGLVWSAFEVSRRQTYILINQDGSRQEVNFGDLSTGVATLAAT